MTRTDPTADDSCAFPPHPRRRALPGRDDTAAPAESALSRFRRWVAHAPAERAPLPAAAGVWPAAEIMHLTGISGMYPGMATLAAAGLAYGVGEHRQGAEHPRIAGAELAGATAAAGGWVTIADVAGPLAGPAHLLSVAYLAACGGGYWWLRRHKAVRAARDRRDQAVQWQDRKAGWHRLAPALGLDGSHLLEAEDTLLGETMLIDTRGTRKLASQISTRHVAERLGEIEMIPAGRIDVSTDSIPGRIRITIRRQDPWAHALMHPVTHPDSPFAKFLEDPASVRKPVVIGGDPETGRPLKLVLWDPEEGGKVIAVIAKKGSGKTVLLSDISERITAAGDAILIQVNLGKHREDARWRPLTAASALGRDDLGRARRALAWVVAAIEERSKNGQDSKVTPTPATPLIVVKVDEIDQVSRDPVCRQLLSDIASKCRSEAVTLLYAGQRATAQWVGGADLRANTDIAVLGRFSRPGEARKATGEEIDLPDMGAYGEGKPGVWLIYELGGGGGYDRGRVFMLEDPREIEAIVTARTAARRRYVPEPALRGLDELWDAITGTGPLPPDEEYDDEPGTSGWAAGGTDAVSAIMPGTQDITAKTSTALDTLAASDTILAGLPPLPPEMAAHAAQLAAQRASQALAANYGDLPVPARERDILLTLCAAPEGTTSSEAGARIGKSKTVAFGLLTALRAAGLIRLDGSGRGARFRLADAPGPRGPGLALAPEDTDDQEDEDDATPAAAARQGGILAQLLQPGPDGHWTGDAR